MFFKNAFQTTHQLKRYLPWVVIVLSLACFLGLYDYYQRTYILSTKDLAFFDNAEALKSEFPIERFINNSTNKINVVYFWQTNCPCDATVTPHYQQMRRDYQKNGIDFHVADLSRHTQDQKPKGQRINGEAIRALRTVIHYTPSVAIWNQKNELVYYGPHSLGDVCNAETSFINKVLDALLQGRGAENTNTIGEGCFCSVDNIH